MTVEPSLDLMMTVPVLSNVTGDNIEMNCSVWYKIENKPFVLSSVRGSINKDDSNSPNIGEEGSALIYEIERVDNISKGESLVQMRFKSKQLRGANCSEGAPPLSMVGCSRS